MSLPVIDKRIITPEKTTTTVWGIFDAHVDNRMSDLSHLRREIDQIKADPTARVIMGGDFNDLMFAPGDPRYVPGLLHKSIVDASSVAEQYDSLADCVVDYNLSLLDPIKDRIDMYLSGNHEWKFAHRHTTNVARRTAKELKVPFVGAGAFIRYFCACGCDAPSSAISTGYIFHGKGVGAPMTKGTLDLTRSVHKFVYDWHMRGHIHEHTATDYALLRPCGSFGKGRLTSIRRSGIICGTYERCYTGEPTAFYSEQQEHNPAAIGAGRIYLDASGYHPLRVTPRWN